MQIICQPFINPRVGINRLHLNKAGTPLTVVTYNASHFYWDRKYTMNEAAAYIKQLQPDIICFQELPVTDITIGTASGTLSIMYCINISAGVQTIYRLRSTAVIRSIR